MLGHLACRFNDLSHTVSSARAQIEAVRSVTCLNIIQCLFIHQLGGGSARNFRHENRAAGATAVYLDVRCSEVGDVNVIAHAGAILGRVVRAKDFDLLPLPERDLQDQRNKVRFMLMVLANLAAGVSATGVEITQADILESVRLVAPVFFSIVFE